jgi:hypothetical protein
MKTRLQVKHDSPVTGSIGFRVRHAMEVRKTEFCTGACQAKWSLAKCVPENADLSFLLVVAHNT